ncbi:MAG: pilin [Gammaproteobacteria bacterium]|nr:pilin [Gammaproteobacteria bacterium]MCI0590724.1 pilin [Gammaproteobacteria bacterium]
MKTFQQGFTLIELMIVVAIIGILAAVAIPAYQDYTVRAKVSEALSLASAAKTGVSEWFATNGNFPSTNASVGLPPAASITGNSVRSVAIAAGGVITVTLGATGLPPDAAGTTLLLTPTNNVGAVQWTCTTGGSLLVKYRPASCRP